MILETFLSIRNEGDTRWRLEPDLLLRGLTSKWPMASVRQIGDPKRKYSHEWTVPEESGNFQGLLNRKGTCVALTGSPEDTARFVHWLRGKAPNDVELELFDAENSVDLLVTQTVTRQQIVDHLKGVV